MISIITASYNYENFIKETIESVLNQTYTDWEMIIVDDGSKDNSIKVIQEYVQKDSRIMLYTHENNLNRGLCETIKLGISKAKGDYIVFLESDDYIRKDYLQKKLDFILKNPDVKFVINKVKTIGTKNAIKRIENFMTRVEKYWEQNPVPHKASNELHFWNTVPTFSCVMVKTDLLKECFFDVPKPAWLDWWLWTQISKKTKFYSIPEELTFWRIHDESYICRERNDIEYIRSVYNFWKGLYKILPPIIGIKPKFKFLLKKFLRAIKYNYLLSIKK